MALDEDLLDAVKRGDAARLGALLDAHPEKLHARFPPYDGTLLHAAANSLPCVNLLLDRGADVNARERGDNTYALHWAAAAGNVEVVRRLLDAGGDPVGHGDDHELDVIGWATCWDGTDTPHHRAVAELLLGRGAPHHIFSAIGTNDAAAVRRVVAANPGALNRRMSRNENHRLPLQLAVQMNRPDMVRLLLDLGADPLGVDRDFMPSAVYATSAGVDRPIMERIRPMTLAELDSAERGHRAARLSAMDLWAAVALADWPLAERLVQADASLLEPQAGALHLMAKRGDVDGVRWLLAHGADPNGRWAHWEADVTPLHLAVLGNHGEVIAPLLEAGADPTARDSRHDSDAIGWAEFFGRDDLAARLRRRG